MKIKITYDVDLDRDIRRQCIATTDIPLRLESGVSKMFCGHGSSYQEARAELIKHVRLYIGKPAPEEVEVL